MSSETAMKKNYGEVAEYRSSEGKTVRIPYRGDIDHTVKDILGGLKIDMYICWCIYFKKCLARSTTFVRVHRQFNQIFR